MADDSGAAGFWSRLLAMVIDGLALIMVFSGAAFSLGIEAVSSGPIGLQRLLELSVVAGGLLLCGPIFLGAAYFVTLHAAGGYTVGKAIMGIRVIDACGNPLGLRQSFLRWLSYPLSALPFGLGFFWIVLDGQGRGWHDILTHSKVVNE